MVTCSVIKADTGGFVGHSAVHPRMLEVAGDTVDAPTGRLLRDGQVATCGDDLSLIMSHEHGVGADRGARVRLGRVRRDDRNRQAARPVRGGAGHARRRLLRQPARDGSRLRGDGVHERPSEPILLFLADKTEPGAWNLPLFRMFADPFTTAGLVIDAKMHAGFTFEVYDLFEEKRLVFDCPAEMYDLLMFIGAPSRYVVHSVRSKTLGSRPRPTSTQRLSLIAGKYVGKDDPVMIVRCQSGLPAVGEVLEPFALPPTRGRLHARLASRPAHARAARHAHPSRFDGPPRVVALGYQFHDGHFIGPRDMFDDPAFDRARATANEIMDYLRRHGPFEPHRLPLEDLEYTTMPDVAKRLAERWQPIEAPAKV